MWVVAEYEATAFFSLKPASATSSGGRTLLVPTPFAIKMAILDVACRVYGVGIADDLMTWLSPMYVAIRPPKRIVVNNTFIKVLRPRRSLTKEGSADAGYFGRTISYREYAQLGDTFSIALRTDNENHAEKLSYYLMLINYLGKRGSFIQIQAEPDITDYLSDEFIVINDEIKQFGLGSIMTQLDDTAPYVTFKQVNIYSSGSGSILRLGKNRLLRHVTLPYQLVSSSQGYSYYELRADV